MPLSDADLLQSNTGSITTGQNATLPSGTTAGSTLILVCGIGGGFGVSAVTGFTRRSPNPSGSAQASQWTKSNVGAGETAWAVTLTGGTLAYAIYEFQGIDIDTPADATPSAMAATSLAASLSTFTSGTNPRSSAYDAVVIANHVAYLSGGPAPTISGHTGGFTEVDEQANGSNTDLSVSMLYTQTIGTFDVDATRSDGAVGNFAATHVVYSAQGAGHHPDIAAMFGGEIRTAAGLNTGNVGAAPFDDLVGSPTVGNNAANARTGDGYLEISASAASEYVGWTVGGALGLTPPATLSVLTVSFGWRSPSSLPAGDAQICSVGAAVLRYVSASTKLGFKVSAGAEVLSAGTVAADTWYQIDLRYDIANTSNRKGDWQIDGVAQTQATHTAGTLGGVWFGLVTAGTATFRYDDIVVSKGGFPLGAHAIYGLPVDPAGTLTISGTTANFQTFTANGTLVAWNATTARGAIDDVPVTLGAGTSDGFAQITSAASDYVEIPMETRQAIPDESIRGVRVYVPGWSPSATAQGFRLDSYDGTTATTLFAVADPNFDNSTTSPAWVCRMAGRPASGTTSTPPTWTQPMLDGLAFRLPFSNAAQDVGIHSIMAEVATQPVPVSGLFGDLATAQIDPVSGGVLAVTVDTNMTHQPADLTYEEAGVPTTVNVATDTIDTSLIEAPDATTMNRIELQPEAEPPP